MAGSPGCGWHREAGGSGCAFEKHSRPGRPGVAIPPPQTQLLPGGGRAVWWMTLVGAEAWAASRTPLCWL
jgi:hypothetical protein